MKKETRSQKIALSTSAGNVHRGDSNFSSTVTNY